MSDILFFYIGNLMVVLAIALFAVIAMPELFAEIFAKIMYIFIGGSNAKTRSKSEKTKSK